jgi:hypothetical protein
VLVGFFILFGERRKEKGERRKEKGERRKEKGEINNLVNLIW